MKRGDYNWNWDEAITFTLDDEDETLSKDKLNRRRYAEYLYYYLKDKGKKNNTVINLNAEWGAGKSFFIKRFYCSIKDVHPCVYIDAWKQDFSDDAFLTLFSSLSQQLQEYAGKLDARLIQSGHAIGRFTKGVIPEIMSGLIKTYAGIESVGDIAKEASLLMLNEHQEKLKSIQVLKKELALWSRLAFEREFANPIFILIDELDRCRPDYAISLLEIVKHIFDIKNFVFIIATDTDQLQHSIKNVYGNDFSANDYLGRFFHRRFTLKSPELNELINGVIGVSAGTSFEKISSKTYPLTATLNDLSRNISSIFEAFGLNLRDSIRNTERLIDILNSDLVNKKIDYIFMLSLMIIYDKDRQIIDAQVGRRNTAQNFIESIKQSSNLKGVSQATLKLIFDTNQHSLGVDYIYTSSRSRLHIPQIDSTINLLLITYLNTALHFIRNIKRFKNEIDVNRQNSLMTAVQGKLDDESSLKYLQGALLENGAETPFYTLNNYIELIELATSFD
ncbi:KAP family P-loop NTPase fold protein [Klebsiella pneumoniae]